MQRCIDLALLSKSEVGTNPKVGALLVHDNRIIGEGRYEEYGGAHAEVNAVNDVHPNDYHLIPKSTMFVSLEPCNIFGKTPPCSGLILEKGIRNVVVGCKDPNQKISGSSIELLRSKGVNVTEHVLEKECKYLINSFKINTLHNRPEITLKIVQSKDFYISEKGKQTWLSNKTSKIYSHKLRSESNAILIGTKTAEIDNPNLTVREYKGSNPLRILIDRNLKINVSNQIFNHDAETLIITELEGQLDRENVSYWTMNFEDQFLQKLLTRLYIEKNIGKLIIEGGSKTIRGFVKLGLWDKAIVITAPTKLIEGVRAPTIEGKLINKFNLENDTVTIIENPDSE